MSEQLSDMELKHEGEASKKQIRTSGQSKCCTGSGERRNVGCMRATMGHADAWCGCRRRLGAYEQNFGRAMARYWDDGSLQRRKLLLD